MSLAELIETLKRAERTYGNAIDVKLRMAIDCDCGSGNANCKIDRVRAEHTLSGNEPAILIIEGDSTC